MVSMRGARFKDNWKVDTAKELHDELEVDIPAYNIRST